MSWIRDILLRKSRANVQYIICMSGYLFKYCKLEVVTISKGQNQN